LSEARVGDARSGAEFSSGADNTSACRQTATPLSPQIPGRAAEAGAVLSANSRYLACERV
jgi:hypothetical protein